MPENASTNKDRLASITDSIESGIKDLFQSEKYRQYLTTMSHFHRYSLNNAMLIFLQKPDATLVAGFNKWKDQFGRHVKKGEKGITIIAPTPYKKKIEEEKLDPDTKLPMLDADGNVVTVEKTVTIPMFKPVKVFDLSQTEGKPLPQLASDLAGNVENYPVFLEALKRSSPVPVSIEPMKSGMDGYFSTADQRIAIREGMSEVQTVSALVHEIAHARIHNPELAKPEETWKVSMVSEGGTKHDYLTGFATEREAETAAAEADWRYVDENGFEWKLTVEEDTAAIRTAERNRRSEEVQAESISYAVCAYYGIATGDNSFGYIATWSKDKELSELKESLGIINRTSDELITDIDRHYAEVLKEQELKQTAAVGEEKPGAPEEAISVQEEAAPVAPAPDPAISTESMQAFGYTDADMLPLTKERALELFERDAPIYLLYGNNTEALALDRTEIEDHDGLFGISKEDWTALQEAAPEPPRKDYEKAFRENREDGYMIYQLRSVESTAELRFMGTEYLESHGMEISRDNYKAVYAGTFSDAGSTQERLDKLYERFNLDRPADFRGHSLSVSDILVLRQNGVVSSHYVDSIGFKEVPGFLRGENYLKNAEMAVEDDLGMIDGVINNGTKPQSPPGDLSELFAAAKEVVEADERQTAEKKPSILAKLKEPLPVGNPKTAPARGTEREL